MGTGLEAVKATCDKCLRPYKRLGKKYDEHIASCDGKTPYVAKTPGTRAPAAPPAPPSALDSTLKECQRAEDSLGREIVLVKAHLDRLMKEAVALEEVKRKILEAKTA
jgi:hypothetical protein